MPTNKILLTGGTGLIGTRLRAALVGRGDSVTVVTRDPESHRSEVTERLTFVGPLGQAVPNLASFDAVVHLAGEPILGKRWNARQKEVLRSSRIDSAKLLVDAMAAAETKPRVFLCSSAIGYYGDRGDELLPESAQPGSDFMARLCADWEREAQRANEHGIRTVCVRTGIALGPEGGTLKFMLPIFRLAIGGPIGAGRQYMAWIHADDLVRMMIHAIDEEAVSGPINGTAPNPVTNKVFTKALAKAVRRPAFFPAPPFGLRIMLGEVAKVVTGSQRCVPEASQRHGFEFRFPELGPALADLLD